jgi:hypothetical protein
MLWYTPIQHNNKGKKMKLHYWNKNELVNNIPMIFHSKTLHKMRTE